MIPRTRIVMFLLCMVLMLGFTLQSFLIVPSNDWKWILSTSTVHQNPDEHLAKNNCSQTAGPGSLKAGKNLVDLGSAVPGQPLPTDEGGMERWQSRVLNGLPTAFFRDNLRNDTYYMTSWSNAGFTNEFISYVNMIYLAILTDRVPIIPPFAPDHHISRNAGIIPFGDIFDLDFLRDHLHIPILEWRDVKSLPTSSDPNPYPYASKSFELKSEPLGCWSTRSISEKEPIRSENVVEHIGVDASYTRVPIFTRFSQDSNEAHVVFPRLAALIYRSSSFSSSSPSHIAPTWKPFGDPEEEPDKFECMALAPSGHDRRPEAQLACFDTMYYATSGAEVYEWRFGFSPVWRDVGRWLRFNARIKELAKEYMKVLFGDAYMSHSEGVADAPPFIAVHVRHGDFQRLCGEGNCFPSLYVYQKHVEDIKKELYETKKIEVEHVVVMSDEESRKFWDEVELLGWLHIDHTSLQTLERFGEWYPPLIDIVVQSYAMGFVGTEDSTFSMVSQKRVVDWNGGVVRSVGVSAAA